ncbi:MAG TPA: hypothetical protein VGC99_10580 [Candidatus Tectomicrobia bacterium]
MPITDWLGIYRLGTAMEAVFILIITGLTSGGMFILGVRGLRLSRSGPGWVLGKVSECIGLTLLLFLLNLAVGMCSILAWRSLTGHFVSIYLASDTTLLILSLLQALTFQAWREGSRQHRTSESRGCA